MIAKLIYLFSGLAFMAICWVVAKRQVSRPIDFIEYDRRFLVRYLFSPATFTEATSGVIGSTISFYITVFTSFCLSFGWGSIFVLVLVPSVPVSFLIFYGLVARVVRTRFADEAALKLMTAEQSVTFMDFLLRRHRSYFGAVFCVVLMLVYIVSTVSAEMDSLQIFYDHLTRTPEEIFARIHLPENERLASGNGYKFGLAILLCSLGYVLRGGYPGIMKIDRIQVVLIAGVSAGALGWIAVARHPITLVQEQFIYTGHEGDIIALGLASFFLILTWIPAALDNWLRVAGSMIDRVKEDFVSGDPEQAWRAAIVHLRGAMICATVLTGLISVVPALLGLELRAHAIEIWDQTPRACDGKSDASRPVPNQSLVDELLRQDFPLIANRHSGQTCGDWLAPNMRLEQEQPRFNTFTSGIYDFFSLALADQWTAFVERGEGWQPAFWILVAVLIAVSVICATITTVNSYLLCTAQLVYRAIVLRPGQEGAVGVDAPLPAALQRWWWQPLATTLLISMPIAVLVQGNILTEANYISYGILAFSNIVFLALIAAVSVLSQSDVRVRRCVGGLCVSWLVVIAFWFVHRSAEDRHPPQWLVSYAGWFAPRSYVVLLTVLLCALVWVVTFVGAADLGRAAPSVMN